MHAAQVQVRSTGCDFVPGVPLAVLEEPARWMHWRRGHPGSPSRRHVVVGPRCRDNTRPEGICARAEFHGPTVEQRPTPAGGQRLVVVWGGPSRGRVLGPRRRKLRCCGFAERQSGSKDQKSHCPTSWIESPHRLDPAPQSVTSQAESGIKPQPPALPGVVTSTVSRIRRLAPAFGLPATDFPRSHVRAAS